MHRHIPSAADFMNAAPYSPAPGLSYGAPQLGAGTRGVGAPKGFSALDSFEATSFLDAGLGTEDFFSPFLNPDFPIDISLPLQHLGDNVMQSQAPLMQVAQSQGAGVRRNPKLAAKRKLEAAAKARQPQAQQQQAQAQVQQLLPMQQQQAQPQAQQGKAPLMPMAPAPQPTTSASMRPSSSLSMSSQSLYVDSPPSGGCGDQGEDDYYGGEEPTNKRQKRLVKNRQAAQLFRKRQKQYISDLENKVAEVTNKNIALMAKVDVLVTENQLVKDQLKYLRTFVVSALEQAFPQQKYSEMQQQLGDIGLHDAPKKEPAATASNPTIITSSPSSSPAPSTEDK